MGGYQFSLRGPLPSDGSDGTSRRSSTGGSRSVRGGKQRDSQKGSHHHNFFQPQRVQSMLSPPRRSTACCDGLSERLEIERRLTTIVPLQDFHCIGHSFQSEDNESLALWEEAELAASHDQGWVKLTRRPSPRWLEAMRKFDTTKLAPWRSSPGHPKASPDSRRLSMSDRKGSMKSFHEFAKVPWYSNATALMGNGESRSVRCPLGDCNLSQRSGQLISSSGDLLIPPGKSGQFNRSDGSQCANSSKKRDTQFITEEALQVTSSWDMSSKPEHVVRACLANGFRSRIPEEDINIVQTTGARKEGLNTANPLQLETTTKITEARTNSLSTSRNSSAKAMVTSTCEADVLSDKTSSVQEKQYESSALAPIEGGATVSFERRDDEAAGNSETLATEVTAFQPSQPCLSLAILSTEQEDDTSLYEALRRRYILKAESEPLDGNYYVIQPRKPTAATRAQSIVNKDEESGVSSQSCLLNLRSSNDAYEGHSSQVEASSTSDRMFVSLRNKVWRPPRPGSGKKKKFGDFLESSSPRSILCGLAEEGSLPSSNPSLRSDPGMATSSALLTSASESYSSSDASSDLNEPDFEVSLSAYNMNAPKPVESQSVSLSFRDSGPSQPSGENAASKLDATAAVKATTNTELLGCEVNGKLRSSSERISTTEPWTATFPIHFQESSAQVDSACAPTEFESAFTPSNAPPARRLSDASPSTLEDPQVSSVVPTSRTRHNDSTDSLGGMFSPLRLTSKCQDTVSSNHNCFVASSNLSSPPHDNNLGNRSSTYESTLELLTLDFKERKSKSKWQFSNRRHSSADSYDAPTMMISINKAMKKILSKCTATRSNSKGKS